MELGFVRSIPSEKRGGFAAPHLEPHAWAIGRGDIECDRGEQPMWQTRALGRRDRGAVFPAGASQLVPRASQTVPDASHLGG